MVLCPPVEPDSANQQIKCGRLCAADPPPGESDVAVYVGRRESYQLLLAVTFVKCGRCLRYDPKTKEVADLRRASARELARRHYLVEKAKDAERIGVLVGTLGASRYRDVVDQTLASIRRRGKRAYVFLVGKPNVPKLANFPEVDVFVLVACPENSLVTSREYLRPIVTPYELDLALNPAREWTGEFEADFAAILPGREAFVPFSEDIEDSGDVSLLTGRIREMKKLTEGDRDVGAESSALLPQETGLSVLHEGGGGEFLGQRTWRGLEQKLGQTEVAKAVAGQSGIAMGYRGEGAGDRNE